MPRFFFQLIDQGDSYRDTEGMELATLEAARREAAVIATEVARDVVPSNGLLHSVEVIVYDVAGNEVWRSKLSFETLPGPAQNDA